MATDDFERAFPSFYGSDITRGYLEVLGLSDLGRPLDRSEHGIAGTVSVGRAIPTRPLSGRLKDGHERDIRAIEELRNTTSDGEKHQSTSETIE